MKTNNSKSAKGAKPTKPATAPAPEQRRLIAGGAVRVLVPPADGSPTSIPKARNSDSYEEIFTSRQQSVEQLKNTGPVLNSAIRATGRGDRIAARDAKKEEIQKQADARKAEKERQTELAAKSAEMVRRFRIQDNIRPRLYDKNTPSPSKTDTDPGQAKTAAASPSKTGAKSVQAKTAASGPAKTITKSVQSEAAPLAVGDNLAQDESAGINHFVDLEMSFDADELPRYENLDICVEEEIETTMRNLMSEAQRVSIHNEKLEMELAKKDELVDQLNHVCDDRDELLRKNKELNEVTNELMQTFEEKMKEQEKLRRESELREQELALARQEQERLRRESELRDKEIVLMRKLVEKLQAERESSEPRAVHYNGSPSVTNVSFDSIYAQERRSESVSPPMRFQEINGSAFQYPQANTSNALVFFRPMPSPGVSAVQRVGDFSSYVSPVMSGETLLSRQSILYSNLLLRFRKLFSAWNGVVIERKFVEGSMKKAVRFSDKRRKEMVSFAFKCIRSNFASYCLSKHVVEQSNNNTLKKALRSLHRYATKRIGRRFILARHLKRVSVKNIKLRFLTWRIGFTDRRFVKRKIVRLQVENNCKFLRRHVLSLRDYAAKSADIVKQITQAIKSWSNKVETGRFKLFFSSTIAAWRAVKTVHSRIYKFLSNSEKTKKMTIKCKVLMGWRQHTKKIGARERKYSLIIQKIGYSQSKLAKVWGGMKLMMSVRKAHMELAIKSNKTDTMRKTLERWFYAAKDSISEKKEKEAVESKMHEDLRSARSEMLLREAFRAVTPAPSTRGNARLYFGYPPSLTHSDISVHGEIQNRGQTSVAVGGEMGSPDPAIRLNFVSLAADTSSHIAADNSSHIAADNSSHIVPIGLISPQKPDDSAAQVLTVIQAPVTTLMKTDTTQESEKVMGVEPLEFHTRVVKTAKSILDGDSRILENFASKIKFQAPLGNWKIEEIIEKYVELITGTNLQRDLLYEPRPANSKLSFGQSEYVYLRSLTRGICDYRSTWVLCTSFKPAIMALIMATKKLGSSVWVPHDDAAVQVQVSGGGVAMAAATVARQAATQQATQPVLVQQAATQPAAAGQQTVTQTQAAFNTITAFDEYGRQMELKFKRY